MSTEKLLKGIVRLESVYDALLFNEPKYWPESEDKAGGCVWQARQTLADLLHEAHTQLHTKNTLDTEAVGIV